jgi:hypothetical protein
MRNTPRIGSIIAILIVSAGALACTGGGGTGGAGIDTWESASSTNEGAANSREPARTFAERAGHTTEGPPRSTEGAPGSQVGGQAAGDTTSRLPDLDCSGTYKCIKVGDDNVVTYKPSVVSGFCIVNGMIVDRGGNLLSAEDGKTVVGTWSGKAPVTITTGNDTRICTKDT